METGDTILFGQYYQVSANEKNDIEWIILEKKDDAMLLLSKNALDIMQFDTKLCTNWEKSKLRKWLNEGFINEAFNEEEKNRIIKKEIVTKEDISDEEYRNNFKRRFIDAYKAQSKEPDLHFINSRAKNLEIVDQGKNVFDSVFLLSPNEVECYLNSQDTIRCKPTAYAKEKSNGVSDFGEDGYCSWWLRSMACEDFMVCFVNTIIPPDGHNCMFFDYVRPAIWISLN